jgi:hypothetical protein
MFRALVAHPQDALHKRYLVYGVRVISVDFGTITVILCTKGISYIACVCQLVVARLQFHCKRATVS